MLRTKYYRVQAALLAVLLVSLTGLPARAETPEGLSQKQVEALEQRVRERWQTVIDHDFEKTWAFSTPTFRGIFPKSLYVHNFSYAVESELTSVEVVDYDADAAVASVVAGVMSKSTKQTSAASRALGAVPITVREKWIFTEGEWWHSTNE